MKLDARGSSQCAGHVRCHCYKHTFLTHTSLPFTCPFLFLPSLLPYVCVTNHSSYHHTCYFLLQDGGWNALIWASRDGDTEAFKTLLTAPAINVNHANVSIYSLNPPHVVVEGDEGGGLSHFIPHPSPSNNVLLLPKTCICNQPFILS